MVGTGVAATVVVVAANSTGPTKRSQSSVQNISEMYFHSANYSRSTVNSNGVAKADGLATGELFKSGIVAFAVTSTEPDDVGVPEIVVFISCVETREI